VYGKVSPHGKPVPREVTDRVLVDKTNMRVNTSVMVVVPSMLEFAAIRDDLRRAKTLDLIGKLSWPEMQYLTLRWSGSWTSIDLRYGSFSGYPGL
jgi:glycogenin glucosyltransferase